MLDIFDVRPVDTASSLPVGAPLADGAPPVTFVGESDGGVRHVTDGSQILAQSIVAAGKVLHDRSARSASVVFVAAADPSMPLEFTVEVLRTGRSFATTSIRTFQGNRLCATATVLFDQPQPDLMRHGPQSLPRCAGPDDAIPVEMPMIGRELRVVDVHDVNDPYEAGPPVLDAWLHYDQVPERDDLCKALLAHFTGHLGISAAMRAHQGIGTSQAHDTLSTAVIGITVTYHEPVAWTGWIRYHHESTYAGAGMAYIRGQVVTEDGQPLASFTQDAMARAIAAGDPAAGKPQAARL